LRANPNGVVVFVLIAPVERQKNKNRKEKKL